MSKKRQDFNVTMCMADGRQMSGEEFMEKPYVVEYQNNKEIYQKAIDVLAPELTRAKMRHSGYVLTKQRKEKLERELAELYKNM